MVPIIVLGCDSNGYGVIRSIVKFNKKIKIIGIDFNRKAPAFYSKFLYSKKVIIDPCINEEKAIDEIILIGKKLSEKVVVIITSDIFLSLFNKYREILSEHFLYNIPEKYLLNQLLDKRMQYKLISNLYEQVPKTFLLTKETLVTIKNSELQFPVFVKGAVPHLWKQYFTEKGFVAKTPEELDQLLQNLSLKNLEVIVQELIPGPNYNHYKVSAFYSRSGEPKLFFTTQKVRQFPFDFGVGSYMKSKRVDELLRIGRKIFCGLSYTGIGSIEFKVDERDGKFKFIELNPRMWQQNYQATLAGLNFAEYYYKDCIGENIEFKDKFLDNITYMDTVNDFQSFMHNKKITGETYLEWMKQVMRANSYSFFQINDLKPIFVSSNYGLNLLRYLKNIIKRVHQL